ncbi:MAG: hypothetical protein IKK74_05600 [Clostridia bacterium]|nr:hypothetical protein [Clostridia bacterium]
MYTAFSRYYRFKLSVEQKKIYDALLLGLENRENEISTLPFSTEDFNKILYAINFDNPHLYYVDFSRIRGAQNLLAGKFYVSYLIDEVTQRALDKKIDLAVSKIIKQVVGQPLNAAALLLHDWLVTHCTYGDCYDVPNASHSIVGAFLYSKCVCEGYAKAYKYLADKVKLRAIVVVGQGIHPDGSSGGHAWNIIMLDNVCYYVDVTFDLLFAGKYCSRAYYMLSTKEIVYDHSIDETFDMPDCPNNGNILRTVSGTVELIAFLDSESRSGVTHSEVRLTKGFTSDKLMSMMKNRMTLKDARWYSKIKSISYGDYSRSLFICWK